MSCGFRHSIVVTTHGTFGFGKNISGELGLANMDNKSMPVKLPMMFLK